MTIDPGDLDGARRRHPSAYEYEHDLDPDDHADAYVELDDEPLVLVVVDEADVVFGPDARARFADLVDDELERLRTLRGNDDA